MNLLQINTAFSTAFILSGLLATAIYSTPSLAEATADIQSEQPLTDEQAEELFNKAMQDRDSGRVFDAIETFEFILSRRPSLNRARLELAVSYHRASEFEQAYQEFQEVLENPDTPEKVRLAILAYLGQLTSDEMKPQTEHTFSYYTRAGALYNTNINFAPLRGSPDYNIPDGEDTASPGIDTFFSASHRYRDNKPMNVDGATTHFEWHSQASWTGNNYTRNSDFSINIISASTGPAFISTGRWRGAISLQVDQTYFGGSTLGTFISVNPLVTFDLGNYRGVTIEATYMDNNFARTEDQGRDGDMVLAGAAYTTLINSADNGLELGFRLRDLTADDPQYGYESTELYFGGFVSMNRNSNVYLNMNYEHFAFDGPDTVSGTVRDEDENIYVLGYNYDFAEGMLNGWTLNTYISYTKNISNVDVFSYDRRIFAVNLARFFI